MVKLTLRAVNLALTRAGAKEHLVREQGGYYYFVGGDAYRWKESGVYGVYNLNDLTLEQWIQEWRDKVEVNHG